MQSAAWDSAGLGCGSHCTHSCPGQSDQTRQGQLFACQTSQASDFADLQRNKASKDGFWLCGRIDEVSCGHDSLWSFQEEYEICKLKSVCCSSARTISSCEGCNSRADCSHIIKAELQALQTCKDFKLFLNHELQ